MEYYLTNLLAFLAVIFSMILITATITFKRKNIKLKDFASDRKGKGAIASAALALSLIALISFLLFIIPNNANANPFSGGTWFNDASVYVGIDYTIKPSPQCAIDDPVDDRGTSNLGFRGNVWQSRDKTFRWNVGLTHHSCYLGKDRNGYDGFGTGFEWFVWRRK